MIQPVGANLNTKNLEPVKVPHFAGVKNYSLASKKDTTSFTQQAQNTVKNGKNFTKEFFKSFFGDIKKIFLKKSENTVQKMNNIGNIAETLQ